MDHTWTKCHDPLVNSQLMGLATNSLRSRELPSDTGRLTWLTSGCAQADADISGQPGLPAPPGSAWETGTGIRLG